MKEESNVKIEMKDVLPYSSDYKVSNDGHVYSFKRGYSHKLKPFLNRKGYSIVSIAIEKGIQKAFTVHRLVALAFVPNPYNYDQINHKDGDVKNNASYNVEWSTNSLNANHRHSVLRNTDGGRYGISWNKAKGKWEAYFYHNKNRKHLGVFTDKEVAYQTFYEEYTKTHNRSPW